VIFAVCRLSHTYLSNYLELKLFSLEDIKFQQEIMIIFSWFQSFTLSIFFFRSPSYELADSGFNCICVYRTVSSPHDYDMT